jgi:hypothetical protein
MIVVLQFLVVTVSLHGERFVVEVTYDFHFYISLGLSSRYFNGYPI